MKNIFFFKHFQFFYVFAITFNFYLTFNCFVEWFFVNISPLLKIFLLFFMSYRLFTKALQNVFILPSGEGWILPNKLYWYYSYSGFPLSNKQTNNPSVIRTPSAYLPKIKLILLLYFIARFPFCYENPVPESKYLQLLTLF